MAFGVVRHASVVLLVGLVGAGACSVSRNGVAYVERDGSGVTPGDGAHPTDSARPDGGGIDAAGLDGSSGPVDSGPAPVDSGPAPACVPACTAPGEQCVGTTCTCPVGLCCATCDVNSTCQRVGDVSHCEPCGQFGQTCCDGGGCGAMMSCQMGLCRGCGISGAACCPDGSCGAGLGCAGGTTCTTCGMAAGQPCCAGDTCPGGRLVCGDGTCVTCGRHYGPCCSGNQCEEGLTCAPVVHLCWYL